MENQNNQDLTSSHAQGRYIFPKWTNSLPAYFVLGFILLISFTIFVFWYWLSPKHTDVGYMPKQPVPYSHKLHAGELGIDCRYCHVNVERSKHATVPATEICMNCHTVIRAESPKLAPVRESVATGKPIKWAKVHQLPDYVYFDHSRHVNSGVACVTCHGRVDQMEVVHQVQPLSMSWCLDCHRSPEKNIRPKEFVTKMDWSVSDSDQLAMGREIMKAKNIHPREDCSACHR